MWYSVEGMFSARPLIIRGGNKLISRSRSTLHTTAQPNTSHKYPADVRFALKTGLAVAAGMGLVTVDEYNKNQLILNELKERNPEAMGSLVARKYSVSMLDSTKDAEGKNIFLNSVEKGDLLMANVLIAQKVDLNVTDKEGNTAIHLAAASGSFEMVMLLLENGLNVNTHNKKGQTPLYRAIEASNFGIARKLRRKSCFTLLLGPKDAPVFTPFQILALASKTVKSSNANNQKETFSFASDQKRFLKSLYKRFGRDAEILAEAIEGAKQREDTEMVAFLTELSLNKKHKKSASSEDQQSSNSSASSEASA